MTNTTTTTTTTTTNNALVSAILANRGFANRKVNNDVENVNVKKWHETLDELLKVGYRAFANSYNGTNADLSEVYPIFKKVLEELGTLENGGRLRNNSDMANAVMVLAVNTNKIEYSAEVKMLLSSVSLDKKLLRDYTLNGDMVTPKGGISEDTINNIISRIDANLEEIKRLKEEVENSAKKLPTRISPSIFYKRVEDYLADCINEMLVKTAEEIEEEEKARKAERNAKANARKAEKKAKEKAEKTEKAEPSPVGVSTNK